MIFHLIHKDMHTLVTLRMTFHWAITENWNILSMEPTNQPWWMPNTYKRESYQIPSPCLTKMVLLVFSFKVICASLQPQEL